VDVVCISAARSLTIWSSSEIIVMSNKFHQLCDCLNHKTLKYAREKYSSALL
jgi:hypothetical protein